MDEKEKVAFDKIEKMYKNPASHKFVLHLVHAYVPIQLKASKIFDSEGVKKCAVLNEEILTAQDVVSILTDDRFIEKAIRGMFDEQAHTEMVQEMETRRNGREVGYQGENTTTYLSQSALIALQEFVAGQLLIGDTDMNYLVSKMRRGY